MSAHPGVLNPQADSFCPETRYAPVSDPLDQVNFKIMRTGLSRECRAAVAMLRPPEKKRFNGDLEKHDFETHLICYERAMKQEGITDEIRVGEFPFWFSGVAIQFIELYYQEEDSSEQYKLIIARLKQLYGNKSNSVENMLDKILNGTEVKTGDQKAVGMFLVELEKFDLNATKTNRRKLLDSSDTINRIIRKRIPSVKGRWAKEMNRRILCWNGIDEEDRELKYKDFVKFIQNTLSYAEQLRSLNGKEEQKKPAVFSGQNKTINAVSSIPNQQKKKTGGNLNEGNAKAPLQQQQQKKDTNNSGDVIHAFNRQPGAHPGGKFGPKPNQNHNQTSQQRSIQRPGNNSGGGGGNGGRGGFRSG